MNTKNVITVADIKEYFNNKTWTVTEYNHRSIDYIDRITLPFPIHVDDKKMSGFIEKLSELCKNNESIVVMDSYSDYCKQKGMERKNECI
jgi:hypothetical protein